MYDTGTDTDGQALQLGDRAPDSPQSRRNCILGVVALLVFGGWVLFAYSSDSYTPLSNDRLAAALPKPPAGWRLDRANSRNPTSIEIGWTHKNLSSASSRTYTQANETVTIEIWDWAGSYPFHLPFDVPGWVNGDEVRLGADTGRVRYNRETRTGRLRVRYLDRFYVVVEGQGIDRSDLLNWYRRIDLTRLRG